MNVTKMMTTIIILLSVHDVFNVPLSIVALNHWLRFIINMKPLFKTIVYYVISFKAIKNLLHQYDRKKLQAIKVSGKRL